MGPLKSAALLPALNTCPLLSRQPIIKFFQGTQSPIPRPSALVSPAVSCHPLSPLTRKLLQVQLPRSLALITLLVP